MLTEGFITGLTEIEKELIEVEKKIKYFKEIVKCGWINNRRWTMEEEFLVKQALRESAEIRKRIKVLLEAN